MRDDWILKKFILKMHPESTSINIFDACHSGTIMDLPYQFKLIPSTGCVKAGKIQMIPVCDAFCFSGCRDDQTSQDLGDQEGGALISTLLPLFGSWRNKHPDGNCAVGPFLKKLRKKIFKKLSHQEEEQRQVPMLSCTRKIKADTGVPLDRPSENYRRPVLNTEEAAVTYYEIDAQGGYDSWQAESEEDCDSEEDPDAELEAWDPEEMVTVEVEFAFDEDSGEWETYEDEDWDEEVVVEVEFEYQFDSEEEYDEDNDYWGVDNQDSKVWIDSDGGSCEIEVEWDCSGSDSYSE